LPALREMREDIPQFVVALLDKLARNAGAKKTRSGGRGAR